VSDLLARLSLDDFAARCNETFRVSSEGATQELRLIEANALGAGSGAPAGRAPFSLVFRGPREAALAQQIHPLEHAELGVLELFLVPIGPDALGLRYEATFG
jgi:hypothetical protein